MNTIDDVTVLNKGKFAKICKKDLIPGLFCSVFDLALVSGHTPVTQVIHVNGEPGCVGKCDQKTGISIACDFTI